MMAAENTPEQHIIETTGNTRKLEIKWIFRNATLDWPSKIPGDALKSPLHHVKGDRKVQWCIEICPNGETTEDEGYISAFLHLKSSPPDRISIAAKYSFTLYDEESKKDLNFGIISNVFTCGDGGYGWSKFAVLSDVLESKFFSLTCKLEYEDSKTTISTSAPSLSSVPLRNDEMTSSLNKDLRQLFNNRSGTADVCFVIDGKEIKAHKTILSARSPVFSAMLASGMREALANRVEIKDVTPDIFEALLCSIYTDQVDFTKIDPVGLLTAANKYLLPLLKFQCQRFLAQRITTENCVELLALADLHNAVHLKKSTVNFIRLHITDIMQTEGWRNLKQCHPRLVLETVENLL